MEVGQRIDVYNTLNPEYCEDYKNKTMIVESDSLRGVNLLHGSKIIYCGLKGSMFGVEAVKIGTFVVTKIKENGNIHAGGTGWPEEHLHSPDY